MSESATTSQALPPDHRQELLHELRRLTAQLQAYRAGASPLVQESALSPGSPAGLLVRKFGLTAFERDVLLSTAGVELDSDFARLVESVQDNARGPVMTFALAFSAFPAPHWSAIAPGSVLRNARLLRVLEGTGLVGAPLRAEEAVLHYFNGVRCLDPRLRPHFTPLRGLPLASGYDSIVKRVVELWSLRDERGDRRKPHLTGVDAATARAITAVASAALNVAAYRIESASLPLDRVQLEEFASVWERDAVLQDFVLLVETNDCDQPERRPLANWLASRLRGLVVYTGEPAPSSDRAPLVRVPGPTLSSMEQVEIWRTALGSDGASLNGHLGRIVEQFRLTPHGINEAAEEVLTSGGTANSDIASRAWDVCRRHARGGLDGLAIRVDQRASWDNLVLPAEQIETLQSLVRSLRYRHIVQEEWGFRERSARGLGTSALFWGPSGAGKTLAAEVLANELQLDLYRIDLSATVSKYIGETEKSLKRLFDAAEASGAILLFDEADALFGKRTEVRDSHDRYANLEVSYLLQRMEAYRGLAILTTNLKSALDSSFLRRIRFIVQFPFPAPAERERIWRRAFPDKVPLDPGVEWSRLAKLAVAGGNIANIALDAAHRAAAEGAPVNMRHLLDAARVECSKIEKPLADNETRGWV